MATLKVITVEWREPRARTREDECMGQTVTEGELSKVYIDESLNGTNEMAPTFFHELAHVFFHHCPKKGRSSADQELLAERIGVAAGRIILRHDRAALKGGKKRCKR